MGLIRCAVVFGGESTEYEVALRSAAFVIESIRQLEEYELIRIGISRRGRWFQYLGADDRIANNHWMDDPADLREISFRPDPAKPGFYVDDHFEALDVVFPVLHGKNGEDGTVQGLFVLCGLPVVGCGVLASAAAMDKGVARELFHAAGIPQAAWNYALQRSLRKNPDEMAERLLAGLTFPVFVKPANAGSSVGVSKVKSRAELWPAIEKALEIDSKVVVEQGIVGREIEFAVLEQEDGSLFVSRPGEIRPARDFYDYEAKYADVNSNLIIPAPMSDEICLKMQEYAKRAFRTAGCSGICRADFFLCEDGTIYLNEINTMPGFTSISMYPKLLEISGIGAADQMRHLLRTALAAATR